MNKKKPVRSKYRNPVSYREDSLQWFTNRSLAGATRT
jgi:hypothetical protein